MLSSLSHCNTETIANEHWNTIQNTIHLRSTDSHSLSQPAADSCSCGQPAICREGAHAHCTYASNPIITHLAMTMQRLSPPGRHSSAMLRCSYLQASILAQTVAIIPHEGNTRNPPRLQYGH
eukprot:scaffold10331_cov188-Skeletonema_dohrnii-CCMP3373.AAC.2